CSVRFAHLYRPLALRCLCRHGRAKAGHDETEAPSSASTGSEQMLALRCPRGHQRRGRHALGAHPQALQRYALAVLSHVGLIIAWYLFVKLGEVPKFVMPSPYETVQALLVPNYRWPENIAVTATEIFGGYILAVVFGIAAAFLFSWFRWLEMAVMPLLVSLNMIPKVALGPLIIVWFKYGIGPNAMMAFAICFFAIVLTTARGLREVEPDLLDLVHTLKGSRWQLFTKIQLPGALPYVFSGMKVAAI